MHCDPLVFLAMVLVVVLAIRATIAILWFNCRHLSRILLHESICHHNRRHSLDDRDSARHNAGVVSSLSSENTLARAIVKCCDLVLADGGRRLESDSEEDGHAVADTTLDTAGMIRLRLESGARNACPLGGGVEGRCWHERIVMLAASHLSTMETGT